MFDQYCTAILKAISVAHAPASEKKTFSSPRGAIVHELF